MVQVVDPSLNWLGISYGSWVARWNVWLMSDDPDGYEADDILFMRGNSEYYPVGVISGQPLEMDPNSVYETSRRISGRTALFMPIITHTYTFDDIYNKSRLLTEMNVRRALYADLQEPFEMFAYLNGANIVDNLYEYLIESPVFELPVTENTKFDFDPHIEIGVHKAISKGYFLILKPLHHGKYDFEFGGMNDVGPYFTRSKYHIEVC